MALTSILLPVFNGQAYIEESIKSVIAQEAEFELLIQDDASKDTTPAICQGFQDPRIRYVRNAGNLGCFGSLNAAAARAKGSLLRIFSHDDLMLEGDLREAERCLAENPDYGVAISDYEKIDSAGTVTGSSADDPALRDELPDRIRGAEAAWYLFKLGCISGTQSTITVRRSLFEAVGGFDAQMRFCGDFGFLAKTAPPGGLVYSRRVAAKIRFHAQQTSKDGRRHIIYLSEMREVLERLTSQMDECQRQKAALAFKWIYGYQFFNLGLRGLLKGDARFMREFLRQHGGRAVAGSAGAWAWGLPRRMVTRK